jgi:hypothetical protein
MAYNYFTLEALKEQFGLRTDEQGDYFAQVPPVAISEGLRRHLRKWAPLARDIGTEKARSEMIIAPVLLEVIEQFRTDISIFSGLEFYATPEQDVPVTCDFLLSLSSEQWAIEAPVVAIVEAENEDVQQGIHPCIAKMAAAQAFNRRKDNALETIYGAVTTGTDWRFLRLIGSVVSLDRNGYDISEVDKIVGILVAMLRAASEKVSSRA